MDITHRYFGHDMMSCHVELFKQVIQHDFRKHARYALSKLS
jgi:hypothetical protein